MRRLAGCYLRRERSGHILQTTALVNEVYLRLLDWRSVRFQDRANFFGVAAMLMRRILVDYARHYPDLAGKVIKLELDSAESLPDDRSALLLALDDALTSLAELDARRNRIVELRFFGGLSVNETAAVLNLSARTVAREWGLARAWLYRELTRGQCR
jgi:RNA polymerase sigma factor (TIGR02999 family)